MTEHELRIKADAVVNQTMEYNLGAFEITEETVARRRGAREVTCSCGFDFDVRGRRLTVIEAAKNHLKNVAWEEENLPEGEDPLRRGDRVQMPDKDDQPNWKIVEVSGEDIEVHMNGGMLPVESRQDVRDAIRNTREKGHAVRVLDSDGEYKNI